MNHEHDIGTDADFPEGGRKVLNIGGREIGVFKIEGSYYGLPNICPHQLGPLCQGKISGTLRCGNDTGWKMEWIQEGEILTCPWHGLEYHIPTGQCLALSGVRLRRYVVWEEDGVVKLKI